MNLVLTLGLMLQLEMLVSDDSFTMKFACLLLLLPTLTYISISMQDNDGDIDFVMSRLGTTAGASLLFRNEGVVDGIVQFSQSDLPGAYIDGKKHHSGHGIDLADVNVDGWLDIAIANYQHKNQIILNNGSGGFDEAGVSNLPEPDGVDMRSVDVKFGDVNGDTKPDLVFTTQVNQEVNNQKVLFINTSPKTDAWQIVLTGTEAFSAITSSEELSQNLMSAVAQTENASSSVSQVVMTSMLDITTTPHGVTRIDDSVTLQVVELSIVTPIGNVWQIVLTGTETFSDTSREELSQNLMSAVDQTENASYSVRQVVMTRMPTGTTPFGVTSIGDSVTLQVV